MTKYAAPIIGMNGPKGGVGKSMMSAVFASWCSCHHLKTLLVDTDYGFGKLENLLNVDVEYRLTDYFAKDLPLKRIISHLSDHLHLIAAGHGLVSMANTAASYLGGFLLDLELLRDEYDLIIIDSASGIHAQQLESLKFIDYNIMVTTPDVLSIVDTLYFIKLARQISPSIEHMVLMNRVVDEKGALKIVEELGLALNQMNVTSPALAGLIYDDKMLGLSQIPDDVDLVRFMHKKNKDNFDSLRQKLQQNLVMRNHRRDKMQSDLRL
ncbi:MAG: hypothetical protein ACD_73C00813G0002 [uncultured bacterium]|nr:MAG: hypothetical protein ACD_73C00813G0002 [uncultured bacterium]